jgi:hypothetical protein
VIDEQSRQVEQCSEPGHHKDDMKGFYPEHRRFRSQVARVRMVTPRAGAWL